MTDFIKKNRFLLVLLFFVFLFRIPSLFEPYWYGDEGIYLTLGLAVKKGLVLYKDVYDNKTPLIYWLAALADGKIFWFRFMLLTNVLASIYFFYRLALKIFSDQVKPARVATILLAIITSLRLIEGNIANSEIFILLPTLIGFNLVYPFARKQKILRYFYSGLILSLGFLFKVPALFDFLVLLGFLILFEKQGEDKLISFSFGLREIVLSLGYLLPVALSCFYFLSQGALKEFFQSAFVDTLGYLSSWKTGSHSFSLANLVKSELVIKLVLSFVIVLFVWVKRKVLDKKLVFIFFWFILSLFAVTLSGRPYPHYLIQALLPLCLAFGLFWTKINKTTLIVLTSIGVIFALSLIRYNFWTYPTLSYWKNFYQFVLGQKDKNAYFTYFNRQIPEIYSLANLIALYTQPEEKVFLWANDPYLYALSRRVPSTRYTVAYHVIDLKRSEETIKSLQKDPPSLIVVNLQTKPFPELEKLLNKEYLLRQTEGNFLLYLKKI